MSVYTSQTRFTGTSGVDVESMVLSLMKVESLKFDKLKNEKTKLEWEQKAYQDVAGSLKTFQNTHLDLMSSKVNMRSFATYNSFEINSQINGKETNVINLTSTDETQESNYKMKVESIASKDVYSGSPTLANSLVSQGIKIGAFQEGDNFNIFIDNGSVKNIMLDANDTLIFNSGDPSLISTLLNEKFTEIYGEDIAQPGTSTKVKAVANNGILSIVPTVGHSVKLDNDKNSLNIKGTLKLENFTNADFLNLPKGFTLNNVDINVDTNVETAAQLVKNINTSISNAGLSQTASASLEQAADGSQTVNMNLIDKTSATFSIVGGNLLATLGIQDEILSPGNFEMSTFLGNLGFKNTQTGRLDPLATMAEMFGLTQDGNFNINGKIIPYNSVETVSEFMGKINTSNAKIKMSFDTNTNSFLLESTEQGFENRIVFGDIPENNIVNKLGLTNYTSGNDAKFSIDGNNFTRSTNDFELYGLNFKLNDVTKADEEISVSTKQDVTNPFEYIKTFIMDYNKLLDEIREKYNTPRSKKGTYTYYEPLTEDQKAAMSEKEIENWESEAKKGLLYRDKLLGNMINTMRSMIYKTVDLEDGSKISLHDIGISTSSNYREGGKLIINETKLKESLAKRPNDIGVLFSKTPTTNPTLNANNLEQKISEEGIAERINDVITANINAGFGKLTLKAGSTDSIYLNEISKEILDVNKRLNSMEDDLIKKEENYYQEFSRMEAAINQANSQMASLMNLNPQAGA